MYNYRANIPYTQLTAEQLVYMKNQLKAQDAAQQAGYIMSGIGMAGNLLTAFFSNCTNKNSVSSYSTATATGSSTGTSSTQENQNDVSQYKETVESILGKEVFDNLSEDMQKDVLNKYSVYKDVLKLEDSEASRRLTSYLKALQAHQKELEMETFSQNLFEDALKEVAKDPANPTDQEIEQAKNLVRSRKQNCNIKIEDADIEPDPSKATDAEYFGALKNRGQGYVDLYDTDNNGTISFNEFKALEEKDFGSTLKTEEIEITQQLFDKIDKNNDDQIDAHEMASHLYAVSRMHDNGQGPNTVSDITFGEWFDSQHILTNQNVSTRYDNIYGQLYTVLKPEE